MSTHVKECHFCNIAKSLSRKENLKMGTIELSRPLELLCIDYTKLDKSIDGKEDVLVLCDAYSTFTVAIAIRYQTTNTVVDVLINQWFMKYGIPERLHSNQGRNCLSGIVL